MHMAHCTVAHKKYRKSCPDIDVSMNAVEVKHTTVLEKKGYHHCDRQKQDQPRDQSLKIHSTEWSQTKFPHKTHSRQWCWKVSAKNVDFIFCQNFTDSDRCKWKQKEWAPSVHHSQPGWTKRRGKKGKDLLQSQIDKPKDTYLCQNLSPHRLNKPFPILLLRVETSNDPHDQCNWTAHRAWCSSGQDRCFETSHQMKKWVFALTTFLDNASKYRHHVQKDYNEGQKNRHNSAIKKKF